MGLKMGLCLFTKNNAKDQEGEWEKERDKEQEVGVRFESDFCLHFGQMEGLYP